VIALLAALAFIVAAFIWRDVRIRQLGPPADAARAEGVQKAIMGLAHEADAAKAELAKLSTLDRRVSKLEADMAGRRRA
jgi:hypothetical protein